MLNKWIGIGRLTRDPELRYTTNGKAVCNFTLAINRKFKREETDFIDIVVWNQLGENVANYLKKGSLCAVEGALQIRTYENQEGKKVKVAEVVADDVRFLDSKKSGGQEKAPTGYEDLGREVSMDDIEIGDDPF